MKQTFDEESSYYIPLIIAIIIAIPVGIYADIQWFHYLVDSNMLGANGFVEHMLVGVVADVGYALIPIFIFLIFWLVLNVLYSAIIWLLSIMHII